MASAALSAAIADLCAASAALEIFSFLDLQSVSGTSASTHQAPPLDYAVRVLLPFAATVALFAAIAFIYRQLHHATAAAAVGVGNRLHLELVSFVMCAAVGLLEFFLFVQPTGGVDGGAQARALGKAAADALPASATVTFSLGVTLIIVHIRAGGEGGGGAVGGGNRPVPAPVELLKKMAVGAAAALVSQMAVALYGFYANC